MSKPNHDFLTKPVFSPAEAELLGQHYKNAELILEYGAGVSTLLAQDYGRQVVSVESDPAWVNMMQGLLAGSESVHIHSVDIGPTKKWGYPETDELWRQYSDYASTVWDRLDRSPDVILIDGRFRLACFAICLVRVQSEAVLLFDDYANRAHYHQIEQLIEPSLIVDRMAVFHLRPQNWPADQITQILKWFGDPR